MLNWIPGVTPFDREVNENCCRAFRGCCVWESCRIIDQRDETVTGNDWRDMEGSNEIGARHPSTN